MIFEKLELNGPVLIKPQIHEDNRGGFFRFYCKHEFAEITSSEFVQMNHSINHKKGTLRGMHFQLSPYKEEKIISCIRGNIFDVFVDLRTDSPTFLKWSSIYLSDQDNHLLYLPEGFAHGFITLEDNTHIIYQHSQFYTPGYEGGIRYDDPMIKIEWPLSPEVISERDLNHPSLTKQFKGI
jgi:dTDP-4-dehydrorhamnose 3,5-epimerase